jgi:hypothetical protein
MHEQGEPFVGTEALAGGHVGRRALRSQFRPVYRNVYMPKGHEVTASVVRWPPGYGPDGRRRPPACRQPRCTARDGSTRSSRPSFTGETASPSMASSSTRDEICDDELCFRREIPVTTVVRTAFDLGRRKGLTSALIRVDTLANTTDVKASEVELLAQRHPGVRGLVQLRQVLRLMDGGAESPQETRTRLLLVRSGLPKPETQIRVLDRSNYPFARLDMGYREPKVAIEFDGAQHWTDPVRRTADIDRHAELAALGWRIVRVSSDLLRYRPDVIVARVCLALRQAGADWPVIARILRNHVA